MATEREVYEVDTSGAVANIDKLKDKLQEVADETRKNTEENKRLSDFVREDLNDSLLSAQAGYDALKSSLSAALGFVKEGVQGFLASEQAAMRLGLALNNAGVTSSTMKEHFVEQAGSLERLTGLNDDYLMGLQSMLLTMGVAPAQLDRFTKAALNLAAASGQDATTAARLLARAHAEGADELKKYAISVDEAEFKVKGFSAVLDKVESTLGDVHEKQPEQVKQMHELTAAWGDFGKAVGEVALRLMKFSGAVDLAVTILDNWSEILTHKQLDADKQFHEDVEKSTTLVDAYTAQLEEGRRRQEEYANAVRNNAWNVDFLKSRFEAMKETIRQTAEAQNKLGTGLKLDADPLARKMTLPTQDLEGGKERLAKLKAWDDAARKQREENDKLFLTSKSNLFAEERRELEAHLAKTREAIEKQGDWEQGQMDEYRALLAGQYEWEHALAAEAETKRQEARDKELAAEKAHREALMGTMRAWGEAFLAAQVNYLGQALMSNTAFNREMEEMYIQRKLAGLSEEQAAKRRVQIEKELASERSAAFLKMTADALMSIATQAAVKAVLEGAEAVAAAARYDYASAGQHGVAAGLYAGVAIAAGGTAAAISSARGMTRDERQQLEAAQGAEKERKDREAKLAKEAAGPSPAQVNVYNLGITGQTELAQAKELERIRRQFAELNTGGRP